MEYGNWHQGVGTRYEARVGEALWYDQGEYHGRVPVEIRDRTTGEVLQRVGDVRRIGNFAPITVSLLGEKVLLDDLLTYDRSLEEELTDEANRARREKHGIQHGRGPKDWIPPAAAKKRARKGRSLGHSMGATWGVGPFDSDGASELLSEAHSTLASIIGARFEPGSGASNDEVVAAAALLHTLTDDAYAAGGEADPLDISNLSHVIGLFAMGVAALDRVLDDQDWLSLYPEPHRKHAAVRALRNALEEKAVTQGGNGR